MDKEVTREDVLAFKLKNPDFGIDKTAKALGCSRSKVRRAFAKMGSGIKYAACKNGEGHDKKKGRNIEKDLGAIMGSITVSSLDVKTVDEALEIADVDLTIWDIDRQVINSWEVTMGGDKTASGQPETYTNWQVKVFLKKRNPKVCDLIVDKIIDRLTGGAPVVKLKNKVLGEHALLIGIYDHHFGKLAWEQETGSNFNLNIARVLYAQAVSDLLKRVEGFKLDKIYLPIGQDFFHVNNSANTTAHGTQQDVDDRLAKVFSVGYEAVKNAVDLCSSVAPTEVMWVPGNHDPQTSYYLIKVIEAWYNKSEVVAVDAAPTPRKYRMYGKNLLGMTHGDEEPHRDLPTIMAGEVPEWWAQTVCREWFVGHLHKKKETRYSAGDTYGAVGVHTLPSLTGTDAWHYKKGYVKGRRAAEAYLWHKDDGYVGHFSVNAREDLCKGM